jgi:hypothetical protein
MGRRPSIRRPQRAAASALAAPVLLAALLLAPTACVSPVQDAPSAVRHDRLPAAPVFNWLATWQRSDDGTSWRWSGPLWLFGSEAEGPRRASWFFPLWWSWGEELYVDNDLFFPLYYQRTAAHERWRFYTPLYGSIESDEGRADYVLGPILRWRRSHTEDAWFSSLFPLWSWDHQGPRDDLTLVPILGLAHLAHFEWGYPPEGVEVGALGREGSRRFELLNLFGFVSLFGYDDVGDRREWRVLTLLSSEMLSPIRSWRGRGDDPFVREWVFPLYMNVADADGGWFYLGPFWGQSWDTESDHHTDWWLLGLVSRSEAPEGDTWRVLGLPVISP